MKNNTLNFQEQQFELARNIRTGATSSAVSRRLNVYQDLFFNNIEGFCGNAFPVLKSVLPEPVWQAWVRSFLIHSQCSSPFFIDIAEEFLSFLNETLKPVLELVEDSKTSSRAEAWAELLPEYQKLDKQSQKLIETVNLERYPWLLELAHYEWVELYVSTREPQKGLVKTDLDQLYQNKISISLADAALPLAYQYPVQTIKVGHVERISSDLTTLLVYQSWQRDSDTVLQGDTHFLHLDIVSVHLLHYLQNQHVSYQKMLTFLQGQPLGLGLQQAQLHLHKALADFCERGVLIGD